MPVIKTWIEQASQFRCSRNICCDVAAFEAIAQSTGPAKVFQRSCTTVFERSDMINLMRQLSLCLGHLAILTAVCSPLSNLLPQCH